MALKATSAGMCYNQCATAQAVGHVRPSYRRRGPFALLTVGGKVMIHPELIPAEQWKSVVGYEGIYAVSNCGRVKSVRAGRRTYVGRMMKATTWNGYRSVNLFRENMRDRSSIHRLVAAAFIGPCPEGKEVNHRDGVKTNNHRANLEYVTPSENQLHSYRIGLHVARGEKNGFSKLTEKDVHAVRRIVKRHSLSYTANLFGVSVSAIHHIVKGRSWAWLEETL